MAALLQSKFAGLTLRPAARNHAFVSNGNANKVAMKSRLAYQVEVGMTGVQVDMWMFYNICKIDNGIPLYASRGSSDDRILRFILPMYQNQSPFCDEQSIRKHMQVVVGNDEPQDSAMKRFRREVMSAGLVPEVRRRRYFENTAEMKKRKTRDSRVKAKRNKQYPPKTYAQEVSEEPSPFSDMFGTADDIFADVLAGADDRRK